MSGSCASPRRGPDSVRSLAFLAWTSPRPGRLAILCAPKFGGDRPSLVRATGPSEWRGTADDLGFATGGAPRAPPWNEDDTVPKMKSKGAVKKRFRMTKSGKLKCSRPKRGHQHAIKDAKAKRNKRSPIIVDGKWAYLLKRMMGGS